MARATGDSRTQLLDAATRVFRERGYAGSTVDDVCAAAGVTKGSFFHHFESKEALALAAADHFSARADALFTSAPYQKLEDPRARVLGYLDLRTELMRGDLPDFSCLLGMLVQETYSSHPALRDACERHLSAHASMLADMLAEARRVHAKGAKWSPEAMGRYIQGVIQGAFVLAKAKGGPAVAVELLENLRRHVETDLTHPQHAKRSRHG